MLCEHFSLFIARTRKTCCHWNQQVFLAHDHGGGVEAGELEAVAVGDGIGGAGFDAIAAKDAAVVIDVVDLRIAFGGGDADLVGVVRGFDVDAVGGAGGGAEKTGDALLEAGFVALQLVLAAKALLELRAPHGSLAIGVVLYLGGLEAFPQRNAHSLGDGGDIANDRHRVPVYVVGLVELP
jgi:hypothetical protein